MSERRTNSSLPPTTRGLRAWFRASDEGRALFRGLAEEFLDERCRACRDILAVPRVLVVLRRLGDHPGAEVYAESGVLIRFLELPDMEEGELSERFIEESLPRNWRHLVGLPAKRIRGEVFRGVSVEAALEFAEMLGAIRDVDKLKNGETSGEGQDQPGG